MNGVVASGSKAHLLGYVRSLRHCRGRSLKTKYRMRDLAHDSGEYLLALCNTRSLTLLNTRVEHISEDEFRICFSAFRQTLTLLSLGSFATSFSAFVTLVDYFPNIATLELGSIALEPDEGPVPPLSRPLRGKLYVYKLHANSLEFFYQFTKLDLEYEELVIGPVAETKLLQGILRISAGTVKFLRLDAGFHRE